MSAATLKLIRKLKQKKYRYKHELFIAEGIKVVQELLAEGLQPVHFFSVSTDVSIKNLTPELLSDKEMKELSSLSTPPGLLAVFPFPHASVKESNFCLVLDGVTDPGNLGTIIRTADWFGVHKIIAIEGTTDCFNAKCVQSTMGSLARVEVVYLSRENALSNLKGYNLFGADMEGIDVASYTPSAAAKTALVMGSESHGYDPFWDAYVEKITIPRAENSKTESLNVAVATSILLSFLSR